MNEWINKKCFKWIIPIVLICMVIIFMFKFISIKNADDYEITDAVKMQKIIDEVKYPTIEDYERYDIDLDGTITDKDIKIVLNMIIGVYDKYIMVDDNRLIIMLRASNCKK